MSIVRYKLDNIEPDIINTSGITANTIKKKYNPDALINLALYDTTTGTNITNLEDENKASGYLFSNDGIGITSDRKVIWCTFEEAKNQPAILDFVAGSPVLVRDGKIDIDWGNKYSSYVDKSHIRSAVGFSNTELILYVSNSEITINQLARTMLNYGCKYAINCDGGGSCHLEADGTTYKASVRANTSWLLIKKKVNEKMGKRYKICLDAGHGNNTAGKRSPDGKLLEYAFNRAVVNEMVKLLEKDFDIVLTCPDDRDISLTRRAEICNKAYCDIFVSIHANASVKGEEWDSASGWECYVCGFGGNAEKLAKSIAYSTKNSVGVKLRQNSTGVLKANYTVLTKTNPPAVLIESGFMNNKAECALLLSKDYQIKLAKAYAEGIANFYGITLTEPEVKDTSTDYERAVNTLVAQGIIGSPDYWLANKDSLKYLDVLITNMATYIAEHI